MPRKSRAGTPNLREIALALEETTMALVERQKDDSTAIIPGESKENAARCLKIAEQKGALH